MVAYPEFAKNEITAKPHVDDFSAMPDIEYNTQYSEEQTNVF